MNILLNGIEYGSNASPSFGILYDLKIIDCLINFPPLINEHKPLVKVVTNYNIL